MIPRALKLGWLVWIAAWLFCVTRVLIACTEPKNPVPCDPNASWPDPCAAAPLDAGKG